MDGLTNIVMDCVLSETSPPVLLNVVHPHSIPWRQIIEGVNSLLSDKLPLLLYKEWLEKLEAASEGATSETIERIVSPGIVTCLIY